MPNNATPDKAERECQSGRRFSDFWQTCELPSGHKGEHGCTYKGEEWMSWPNKEANNA